MAGFLKCCARKRVRQYSSLQVQIRHYVLCYSTCLLNILLLLAPLEASGAVGGLVGQIAKKEFGCKVIGSAGGPEKCAFVTGTLGFDACIDYKAAPTAEALSVALKREAPEGIDM